MKGPAVAATRAGDAFALVRRDLSTLIGAHRRSTRVRRQSTTPRDSAQGDTLTPGARLDCEQRHAPRPPLHRHGRPGRPRPAPSSPAPHGRCTGAWPAHAPVRRAPPADQIPCSAVHRGRRESEPPPLGRRRGGAEPVALPEGDLQCTAHKGACRGTRVGHLCQSAPPSRPLPPYALVRPGRRE